MLFGLVGIQVTDFFE